MKSQSNSQCPTCGGKCEAGYAPASSQSNSQELEPEIVLTLWKGDILNGFIPKCSYCGTKRKVVGQTERGKYAQENNHRPVNWGYYCQKCYDIGSELEREAMYG